MKSLHKSALIALAAGLLPSASLAQTPIQIDNPGFEADVLNDGSQESNPTDWQVTGWAKVWNPTDAAYPSGIPEGENVGNVQSGNLFQSLNEVLVAGERYTFRVRVGIRADWPGQGAAIYLGTSSGPVASSVGTMPAPGSWEEVVIHYTALPGQLNLGENLTVQVGSQFHSGSQVHFDDLRLTKGEPLRVPSEFPTIQAAIDAAFDGNRIEVSSGTYFEHINLRGKAILLEGVGPTRPVIDGGGAGTVVTCNTGESSDTILRNFRITGAGNVGLRCLASSPTVQLCEFSGNTGFNGGGMFVSVNAPELVTVQNCLFEQNLATSEGGGISTSSQMMIQGCTFVNNQALGNSPGGGIYAYATTVDLVSCVFWDNLPNEITGLGLGLQIIPSYCDIKGSWSGHGSELGSGSIDQDPLFMNALLGDYRPAPCSPLIDAGNGIGSLDLDLGPRHVDDAGIPDTGLGGAPYADMGAYEFDGTSSGSAATYCSTGVNSSGATGQIGWGGSLAASDNNLQLTASSLPTSTLGLFFYGPLQTQVPFGNGNRCIAGAVNRLAVVQTSVLGDVNYPVDLTNPQSPSGQILGGSTWNFQFWFRDTAAGGAGFNLSNGLEVQFCQ